MREIPALSLLLCLVLVGCGEAAGGPGPTSTTVEGRWVGLGRVVVAVPEWWTTGETQCLAPVETTVYYDEGATADCADPVPPATVREVSALAVLDGTSGYGEYLTRDMEPVGQVAGREVLERDGCEEWFEGVCRRVFAVPEEGVVFAVTIHDKGDGDYEEIRDSLRILPDGETTVPLASSDGWTPSWGAEPRVVDAVVEGVESAGLAADVVTAERPQGPDVDVADLPEGSLLDIEPAMGSPIDEGGTVTITVSGPLPGR